MKKKIIRNLRIKPRSELQKIGIVLCIGLMGVITNIVLFSLGFEKYLIITTIAYMVLIILSYFLPDLWKSQQQSKEMLRELETDGKNENREYF